MASKVFNSEQGHRAKVDMRLAVLEHVADARVFEAFCGPGAMWRGAWSQAAEYVGCDMTWEQGDPRRRFIGDNRRVMRAIDLTAYNVFDFDAFGSPWQQLTILLRRRPWAKDELGAVVITDGSSMKMRFGGSCAALAAMAGLGGQKRFPASMATADALFDLGVRNWFKRSRVTPLKIWRAESRGSGKGGQEMQYLAAVFRGTG